MTTVTIVVLEIWLESIGCSNGAKPVHPRDTTGEQDRTEGSIQPRGMPVSTKHEECKERQYTSNYCKCRGSNKVSDIVCTVVVHDSKLTKIMHAACS